MILITNIIDNPWQTMNLKLDNGQLLNFTLWYSYSQQGWFYSFVYGTYAVNNKRVVNSINMLRSIRNAIPFGLACVVKDGYEPVFISDFKSGRASLYILNPTDVSLVESLL